MKKKQTHVVKEVIILMVLLILIMLMMAVALYDFIPSNVNIPETIAYTADSTTTSIKQEIAYTNGGDITADENNTDEEELITALKSYSIQASDLTVYGEKNLYNSGNSNPFDYAEEQVAPTPQPDTTNNAATSQTNGNEQQGTTATGATTTNATSADSTTGTFFESATSK